MRFANHITKFGFPLVLAALLALSFGLRWSDLEKTTGAPNIEASYHVLLTVNALSESPLSDHWLLPTISLGKEIDKGVPWGATVPTKTADYVYTSFPPPGFILPYIYFETLGIAKTIKNLTIFNFFLQTLACALLYILLSRILAMEHASEPITRLAALAGVSLQIFSSEALLSFGLVYWCQQLFQSVILAALILLLSILQQDGRNCRRAIIGFHVLCFLGAWIEWTGFVFNAGLFFILLHKGRRAPQFRKLAFRVVLVSLAAVAIIVLHYAVATGLPAATYAFLNRFIARAVGQINPFALPLGYFTSYGFLIPLVIGAILFSSYVDRPNRPRWLDWDRNIGIVFFASAFPILENIILLQHATVFSFDRLKLVIPAAILLSYAFVRIPGRAQIGALALISAALVQNFYSYEQVLSTRATWREIDQANRNLVAKLRKAADLDCATIASNTKVRGYTNLLLHRAVFENVKPSDMQSILRKASGCSGIYLVGEIIYPDLPQYVEAIVYGPNGKVHITNY